MRRSTKLSNPTRPYGPSEALADFPTPRTRPPSSPGELQGGTEASCGGHGRMGPSGSSQSIDSTTASQCRPGATSPTSVDNTEDTAYSSDRANNAAHGPALGHGRGHRLSGLLDRNGAGGFSVSCRFN